MSAAGTPGTAATSGTAAAMPTGSSNISKAFSWGSTILTGIGAIAFVGTFITTSALVGSSDAWSTIKGKLTGILVSTLLGGLAFAIGITLLIISRPALTSWLPALLSGLALTFSIAALCTAAISR